LDASLALPAPISILSIVYPLRVFRPPAFGRKMLARLAIVLALLAAVLVAPFVLRPREVKVSEKAERLVIITPHVESIQTEFARAFRTHMRAVHGREVVIDWRQPGGTSEIARFLRSEYSTRFETLWRERTGLPFTLAIRDAFTNPKLDPDKATSQEGSLVDPTLLKDATPETRAAAARRLFLESDIGAGIDLFFGGGAFDFERQAAAGLLVARDASGKQGPAAIAEARPDWFGDGIMPQSFGGEPFRDPGYRWVGTVLSAFGICYNRDSLARLGLETPPDEWSDLEDPRYRGQIALADPTKSGSTTKAFEMLVQERIQTLARERGLSGDAAVAAGWDDAMRLILRISANSRYFTDSSAKVPRDVAMGDAAVGMCIDFYGRSYNELYRDPATGESRIEFVMPRGGTSIGADPIGLLRGAPSPKLAHRFIEFVLSPEGQKIWNYRVGAPGGPTRHALRRPPIRRDFYVEANFPHMTDPTFDPYRAAEGFTYHPEWTGALFAPLRFVIRAACMDPHEEQLTAWEALVAAGLPAEGVAAFEEIGPISYEAVVQQIGPALKNSDKVAQVRLGRELAEEFRKRYLAIAAEYGRR
jgi:iron(III) transport system substrate-binding protein